MEEKDQTEELLRLADKLAEEAQSYLDIGHAMSGEDKDLQASIDAYRKLRFLCPKK